MNSAEAERIENRAGRIEALVVGCEAIAAPELRGQVMELLRLVLELHGAGLRRLLEAAAAAPHLEAAVTAWGRDPEVAGLLELHGLELPARPAAAKAMAADFIPLETLTAGR